MFKRVFFGLSLFSAILHAQEVESPQQIMTELEKAENDFEIAQKMFIPWYTGPLITSSAKNVAQGHINLQGYLYFTINHAQFNHHRKSISTPNTYILNPLLVFQVGLTKWLDVTVVPQGFFKWKKDHFADNFGDTSLSFGFQVLKEKAYVPSIRLVLGETFPTGKYQHLNFKKEGIDATGAGAYQTSFGFNISKIFWWSLLHPVAVRLATSYVIPDHRVHVHRFNAYGGGFHTNGKVKVGNTFNADLGIEVSLTQKWVFATDFVYTYSNKDSFHGTPGVTPNGTIAANGTPSSDQFSIAPAIEYNVSSTGGFIGGIWFSPTGRNSPNFVSIVLSYTQYF